MTTNATVPITRLTQEPVLESLDRKTWRTGVAPQLIALFLWVVFFDQLPRRTLFIGGLPPSVLGAIAGGLSAYLLLYYPLAMRGFRTRKSFAEVAASSFGIQGAKYFAAIALGLSQVVWIAVAVSVAVDFHVRGLVLCGLLKSDRLRPWEWKGQAIQHPVFLMIAFAWCLAAVLAARYFMRWIAALLQVYPLIPAFILSGMTIWALRGLGDFRPLAFDPRTGERIIEGGASAFLSMMEWILGFFAVAGLLSADWGAVCETERDARIGGLVGVGTAAPIVATLAMLAVAGAVGKTHIFDPEIHAQRQLELVRTLRPDDAPSTLKAAENLRAIGDERFTFSTVLERGVDRRIGSACLILLGLMSLGPAVFSAYALGRRLYASLPFLSRTRWHIFGAVAALPFIAFSWANRLETIFSIMGALFAPFAGVIAADAIRSGNRPFQPRRGWNPAGLIAWLAGFLTGMIPRFGRAFGLPPWTQFARPSAIFAFLAAFLVFAFLAALRLETKTIEISSEATV